MKHTLWTILGAALLLANVSLVGAHPAHSTRAHAKKPVSLSAPVSSERESKGPDHPFPDVPKDHWAFAAVETVRKAGIIVGYPTGTLTPGR